MTKRRTGSIFRQIPLMVAFLAAFVFSASNSLQLLILDSEGVANTQQQDQDQSEDERPVAYLDYAYAAVTPVAQLSLFQSIFKVAVPAIQPVQDQQQFIPSPRGSDQFFRILFRLIISPNAP